MRIKRVASVLIALILSAGFFVACEKPVETPVDPYAMTVKPDDFSYYPKTVMNPDSKLYVFGQGMDNNVFVTAEAIQGLFAQTFVTFFTQRDNPTRAYLEDMEARYGVTTETVNFNGMLNMYKEKFSSDYGYILYDRTKKETINVACSVSGVTGYIPVDVSVKDEVEAAGIAQKLDVTDKTERWCFDNYKSVLNNKYLLQLKGDIVNMRDFGIANKLFVFYQDGVTSGVINFRGEIHSWAQGDAPIFGWGPGTEDSHVGIATMHSQFTIPSDYCYNLSVFSARDFFGIESFTAPRVVTPVTASPDKHYVCFIRSDGDNIQTWFNTFPFSANDMGATRGDFQMGWSIQPSLTDLAPNVLSYAYRNAQAKDSFVAAVSGMGYMYPNTFPRLSEFTGGLDVYLKRSGLSLVQILDSGPFKKVTESYSRVPSLKGGIYAYGDKYVGGRGSIFWSSNGKPFVSFRESMWDVTPEYIANRVNSFPCNPNDIEGYSLINLHPWSMTYGDVKQTVALFDENVEVVSPDQFFDLIIANLPKVDKVLTA